LARGHKLTISGRLAAVTLYRRESRRYQRVNLGRGRELFCFRTTRRCFHSWEQPGYQQIDVSSSIQNVPPGEHYNQVLPGKDHQFLPAESSGHPAILHSQVFLSASSSLARLRQKWVGLLARPRASLRLRTGIKRPLE